MSQTWVFCCGMYRSGSTLQYQLTSALVEKTGLGMRTRFLGAPRFREVLAAYRDTTGILVVKAHLMTPPIEEVINQGGSVSIGCYRDIRDVAASFMKFWNINFDQLIQQGWLDKAIEYLAAWENHPGHLSSRYETLIQNPASEVLRIANHLNISCSADLAGEIAAEYSIDKQLERVQAISQERVQKGIEGGYYSEHDLLHYNHIENGAVGKWQANLLPENIVYLENRYQDWLVDRKYMLSEARSDLPPL